MNEEEMKMTTQAEMQAGTLAAEVIEAALQEPQQMLQNLQNGEVTSETVLGEGNGVADSFSSLPIDSLICGPIVAAARGQQELTQVYIDTVMKLAYKGGEAGGETNTLNFSYSRPYTKEDGSMGTQDCTIKAPLISLVPVPAFTMDELTLDFDMDVKNSDMRADKTHTDVSSQASFNSCFGLKASISGNVTADSEHKRETDSTATYHIHARAIQQPPSEGMAKLTSLFAQAMEPIPTSS